MSAEELLNAKMPLPTLSQGMTNMSDSYLGDPNFFNKNDAPAISGGAPSSMGPPPSRAWGGSLGNMMMTKSTGTGRQSGGEANRAGGAQKAGYFNNNELSELFSIVRGKSVFGGKKKNAPKPASGPGSAGGAPGMSYDMSMAGMPGMRSLPPIRTKSADQNGSLMSGGVIGESPRSDLGMPDSAGRLVTGLTPQGGMLMGTGLTPTGHGTGLTPTGLTPGSLAGFPGIDHFSMNLPPGEGGLMPGMPGWKDPTGGLGEDPEEAPGGKGKKRKASASGASGGSKQKAPKKSTSKGGKGSCLTGNGSDDDDVPLSGLVRHVASGAQSAAALAEATAKKLGIPMPSQTISTQMTEDDDDDEGTEGGKSGSKSRSRSWLPAEDELVRSLVAQHGPRKWTLIATRLKTKTQKQVYARWRDYLQPGLTTKPWSAEEQARLVELQAHVGNQWAVLARLMPGRRPTPSKTGSTPPSASSSGTTDATGATSGRARPTRRARRARRAHGRADGLRLRGRPRRGSRGGGGAKSVGTAPRRDPPCPVLQGGAAGGGGAAAGGHADVADGAARAARGGRAVRRRAGRAG